jgi:phage portal protein BeeE
MAHNLGVPGIIFSPKEVTTDKVNIRSEATDKIMGEYESRVSGAKRGRPLVLTQPWDFFIPQFKPSEIMTGVATKKADARICAAFSINPAIVGSLLGMEEANHSSLKEYSESFYEMAIIPLWRQMGSELTKFLLPNFEPSTRYGRPRRDKRIQFDIREVRALAQDRFEQAQQEVELFRWGLTTRGEGRERIGLDQGDAPDVYYPELMMSGKSEGVVQPNLPSGGGPSRNGGNNLTDGNNPASAGTAKKFLPLDPATVALIGANGHGG